MRLSRPVGMRAFAMIWVGQLVSTLGSGLTGWGLGVWVYQETGSTTLFTLNLLAFTLPGILLAPVAGAVVDRADRRHVMLLADSCAGLMTMLIAMLLWQDRLAVWHIYLATSIYSAASTFQWPAYGAATTMLVPKSQLGRASGMVQMAEAVTQLITPGLAGALFVAGGLKTIVLIDVTTYAFAILTLMAIHVPAPERSEGASSGSFLQDALFGWRYIAARPGLLGLLTCFAIVNFCASVSAPLLTPMLLDITTPDVLGYIGSASGAGMLIGTLVMSTWGGAKRRIYGIFAADGMAGIFLLLTGLTPYIPLIALGQFGFLLTMPISNGHSQALWQSKVAPDVQGRVFAARRMLAFSIMPVAYAISGPLADVLFEPLLAEGGPLAATVVGKVINVGAGRGTGLMMVVMGVLYTLTMVLFFIFNPHVRRADLELPDAMPEEPKEAVA